MTTFGVILDKCRGERSKQQFAQDTGIAVRTLTALYSGERRPGRSVLQRLIDACPEQSDQLVRFFLASGEHDRAPMSTIGQPT